MKRSEMISHIKYDLNELVYCGDPYRLDQCEQAATELLDKIGRAHV